ncbi:hypothetical protein HUT16_01355 [Kitasatospora sp. NA04385]|uniref:hypothetical protein n=1 Tax=Kitasatospora sp. NA04385 TaxID=2742135 RepID=UPI0015921928|nr:hypothetical protein [Kitasatospora sp. NA04385]QKW17887.1 hypothetical protein HUT16_01355 [Kitasatospora sp. NA04385]
MANPAKNVKVTQALKKALAENFEVVLASVTLTEALQGGSVRCTNVHRYLKTLGAEAVISVDAGLAKEAAQVLDKARPRKDCTIDSLVVAVAAKRQGRVAIVTSDPRDIARLMGATSLAGRSSVVQV